jgi:hypothetical protein
LSEMVEGKFTVKKSHNLLANFENQSLTYNR